MGRRPFDPPPLWLAAGVHGEPNVCHMLSTRLGRRWLNESCLLSAKSPSFPCSGKGFITPPAPSLGLHGAPRE
eukprot:9298395-Pyramimonas_sp.AAC.1